MPSIAELALELEASGLLLKGDTGAVGATGATGATGPSGAASGLGFSFNGDVGDIVPVNTTLGGTSSTLRRINSMDLAKVSDMFLFGYSHTTSGDLRLTLDGINFFKVKNPAETSRFAFSDTKILAVPNSASINFYERNKDDLMVDDWLTVPVLTVAKDMGIPTAIGTDVLGTVQETPSASDTVILYKDSSNFLVITLPSVGTWSTIAARRGFSVAGDYFGIVFKHDTVDYVVISGSNFISPSVVSGTLPSIPTSSRRQYLITDSYIIVSLNNTQYCRASYTVDGNGGVTLGAWVTYSTPVVSPSVNQWSYTDKVVVVGNSSGTYITEDGVAWTQLTFLPGTPNSLEFSTAGLVMSTGDIYLMTDNKNINRITNGSITLNTLHKPYLNYMFIGGAEPAGREFELAAASALLLGPAPKIRDNFYNAASTDVILPLGITRAVIGAAGSTAGVTLPVSGYDGQKIDICCVIAKTTLTVSVNPQLGTHTITDSGVVASNTTVTVVAGGIVSFVFNERANTWLRTF